MNSSHCTCCSGLVNLNRSKKAKTAAADDQAVAEPPGPAGAATAAEAAAGGEKPSEPEAAAKPKPKRIPKPKWPIGMYRTLSLASRAIF